MSRFATRYILLVLTCLLLSPAAMAEQDSGETVFKRGQISEDLYLAGGRIDVLAEIDGDVVAAGGRIHIDSQITGDVMAAGGSVTVYGNVSDDVRLAGGEVIIKATVGDGAIAAGGTVLLAPGADVGGDAMLSGGRVELAGKVLRDLRIASGEVVISGQVDGNVELAARSITIQPSAIIRGNLTYRSPEAANIDSQARIEGSVSHIATPMPGGTEIASGMAAMSVILWLSIAITGVALYLLIPQLALSVTQIAADKPWKTLGLGLAVFAATPVVGITLMITGLGWLLAWLLMSVYAILLLLGFFVGVLFLSNATLGRVRREREPSTFVNSLAFVITLLVIMVIGLVPVLGWLVVLLLLLFGVGGIALQCYSARVKAA